MYIILCGGRNYTLTESDTRWLDLLHTELHFVEVLTGGARGADTEGLHWAQNHNIAIRTFPANWNQHGKAAGPQRNTRMLQYLCDKRILGAAIGVIAFPGSRGTADMCHQAEKAGVSVWHSPAAGDALCL